MPWPSITEGVTRASKSFFESIREWSEEEVDKVEGEVKKVEEEVKKVEEEVKTVEQTALEVEPPLQTQVNTLDSKLAQLVAEVKALQVAPAPTLQNPGKQETVEGTPVNILLGVENADSFIAANLPPGLTMNPTVALITGTPTGPATTYEVTVTAIGKGGSTPASFPWAIEATVAGPVVTTLAPKAVTAQSAEPGGSVNPEGVDTKYRFQYGPTTGYGSQTTEQDAGSGTAAVPVAATIKGTGVYLGAALDYAGVVSGSYDKGSLGSYVAAFLAHFDSWTPENALKMQTTYNSGGRSTPTAANVTQFKEIFEALHTANGGVDKLVRGHNLVWPKNETFSEWVTNPTVAWTATTLKEAFKAYIQRVMAAVLVVDPNLSAQDVINEAVTDEGALQTSKLSEVIGGGTAIAATNPLMVFYAECFKWAHEVAPNVKLFFNEYNVGAPAKETKDTAVVKFAEVLLELGAPVNGVGMQMHQNTEWSPTKAELEAMAGRIEALGLEAEVTEFDMELKGSGTIVLQGELAKHMAEGALGGGIPRLTCWGLSDRHSNIGTSTLTTGPRPLPYNVEEEAKPFGTALAAVRGVPLTSHEHYRLVGYPASGPSPVYGVDRTLGVLGEGVKPAKKEEEGPAGAPVPYLGTDGQTVQWLEVAGEPETIGVSNKRRGEAGRATGYLTNTRTGNPQSYKPTVGAVYNNGAGVAFTAASGQTVWVGVSNGAGVWSAEEVEVTLPVVTPPAFIVGVNNDNGEVAPAKVMTAKGVTAERAQFEEGSTTQFHPFGWTFANSLSAGYIPARCTGILSFDTGHSTAMASLSGAAYLAKVKGQIDALAANGWGYCEVGNEMYEIADKLGNAHLAESEAYGQWVEAVIKYVEEKAYPLTVIANGLYGKQWLEGMKKSSPGLLTKLKMFSYHVYSLPGETRGGSYGEGGLTAFHTEAVALGFATAAAHIWVNEFGYKITGTHGPETSVNAAEQATMTHAMCDRFKLLSYVCGATFFALLDNSEGDWGCVEGATARPVATVLGEYAKGTLS